MAGKRIWAPAGDILRSWKFNKDMNSDRLLILNQIWERELGHFSRHWTLSGVRRGVIYVRTRSPSAAQELHIRGAQIVRGLNKYFKKAWIKDVRQARV